MLNPSAKKPLKAALPIGNEPVTRHRIDQNPYPQDDQCIVARP